ncbi:hypothetical protein B0H19DRAFT_1229908 [Mycena capillaripes]|nr:hypothetical protein B0H19DRAFT_1229908 [Mycena capillaripes]
MLADLEADRARVAELEAQILHLEHSLSKLRTDKLLAQERLDFYKYPVLTLPNEIVSEIFIQFLPAYPHFPPLTGIFSPTLLTHICRRWREIALGTPALWKAIGSYDNAGRISCNPEMLSHLFDTWLDRSRSCPLSIEYHETSDARIDAGFLEALVPHRARWEHLKLRVSASLLPQMKGPMPLLQHLHLIYTVSPANPVNVAASCDVPLLRTVILTGYAALGVILPWAQLTSLTLLCVYAYECVQVLQQTSNLVCCELSVIVRSGDTPGPDITLPCLKSLTLTDTDERNRQRVTNLLGIFIVPSLRSLKIANQFLRPNPIASLRAFVSKSGCKLEEVHITGLITVSKTSYREEFPSIWKFSFDNSDSSDVEA